METEIKIITEALKGLSGDAKTMFIVYVVVCKFVNLLICWAGGITIFILASKLIKRIVETCAGSINAMKSFRDQLDIGCSGSLVAREIHDVQTKIGVLIAKDKE